MKISTLFVITLIFILSLGLRLYRLADTPVLQGDQAEFLLGSAKILNGEPFKLIGIYVSSKPIEGKYFFIGSQFLYFLAFWQWLFKYDALQITQVFVVFNSLAVVMIYLLLAKLADKKAAILAAIIYATNPQAIFYSQSVWNPNILAFLSSLLLLLLFYFKQRENLRIILAGIIVGISISVSYGAVLLIPLVLLIYRKRPWLFLLGIVFGLANLIIFELRHNFYNTTLVVKYYLLQTSIGSTVAFHNFLFALPFAILGLGLIIKRLKTVGLIMGLVLLVGQVYFLVQPPTKEIITYHDWLKSAEIIVNDNPKNFNVAQLIYGDSRSHPLRYLLTYQYGLGNNLKAVDQYDRSDQMYVLYPTNLNITDSGLYELTSFSLQRKIVWTKNISDSLVLSKLTR